MISSQIFTAEHAEVPEKFSSIPGFLIPFWTPQDAAKKKQLTSSSYSVRVLRSHRK
jgi:hypothetical protein